MEHTPPRCITLSLPAALVSRLDEIAASTETPRSRLARRLIEHALATPSAPSSAGLARNSPAGDETDAAGRGDATERRAA